MAVIPYGDLYKLFEMLNKHTKPYDEKKMRKKIRKMTTPKPTLPPPTTKRTAELQPKVPFIYYVRTCWGREGVRKWQFLLNFSTEIC